MYQIQWCDSDASISDIPINLLEPVPLQPFDMTKMSGMTADVILQIMRMAGLTQEVSLCLYISIKRCCY